MGIRFYCPNGHKLNVKEFQAGLKGICPYCGTKIQIPTQSTREPSKKGEEAPAEPIPAAFDQVASVPVAEPTPAAFDQVPSAPTAEPDQPQPPAAEPADPLSEASDVVWYIRPPSGGQFGPAGADTMRTWIAEGRVSPDSLVWREGWGDWREASHVFPPSGAGRARASPAGISTGDTSASAAAHGSRAQWRRKSEKTRAVVIILLIFAVLTLSGVFIWVLTL